MDGVRRFFGQADALPKLALVLALVAVLCFVLTAAIVTATGTHSVPVLFVMFGCCAGAIGLLLAAVVTS